MTPRTERKRPTEIPIFEWIAAALGALLLAGAIAVLVTHGAREAAGPELTARVARVERVAAGWRVEVVFENHGDLTAEQVVFAAEIERGGRRQPAAELTVDRLPARSSRRGGFFLTEEPPPGSLSLRPTSFLQP